MQKELKNQFKLLEYNPMVEVEDIPKIENLFEGIFLDKRSKDRIAVIGIYENGSFTADIMAFEDLVYYVWYHTKYSPAKYIFVENNLLNYNLDSKQKKNIEYRKLKIECEKRYISFRYNDSLVEKEMV